MERAPEFQPALLVMPAPAGGSTNDKHTRLTIRHGSQRDANCSFADDGYSNGDMRAIRSRPIQFSMSAKCRNQDRMCRDTVMRPAN